MLDVDSVSGEKWSDATLGQTTLWAWMFGSARAKHMEIYDDLVLASALYLPFARKSFENALACEVIEHLPSEVALKLPEFLAEVTKELIIISTPNFRYAQGALNQNPFEKHLSFWNYAHFKKLGFRVEGMGIRMVNERSFSHIPILGRLIGRAILSVKMLKYCDLIVCSKTLR
jgi:hypothetical protein